MGGLFAKHGLLLLGGLALGSVSFAAGDEIEFGSVGTSVAAPPPLKRLVKPTPDGICSPGTKNEVCRCVVYSTFDAPPKFQPAVKPPSYCNDPRLKDAFNLNEGQYLFILFQVQTEVGLDAHDGPVNPN